MADDNADWTLTQLLQRAGRRTRPARNGAEALDSARLAPPDAAVLDIGMPDIDGAEVARRLRGTAETADIVLIALSGWGNETDRARVMNAGFDALLSKPADLREVLAAIKTAAARRRRQCRG